MTEPSSMDPDVRDEVLRGVATSLVNAAPDDWEEMNLEFVSTVGVDGSELEVTTSSGEQVKLFTPDDVIDALHDLREAMREPDKGSWFTARLKVSRPGRYEADFDYDSEPRFTPPLHPSAYWVDFDYFPRSPENTPDWLRAALDEEQKAEPSESE